MRYLPSAEPGSLSSVELILAASRTPSIVKRGRSTVVLESYYFGTAVRYFGAVPTSTSTRKSMRSVVAPF